MECEEMVRRRKRAAGVVKNRRVMKKPRNTCHRDDTVLPGISSSHSNLFSPSAYHENHYQNSNYDHSPNNSPDKGPIAGILYF